MFAADTFSEHVNAGISAGNGRVFRQKARLVGRATQD